MPQTIGSMPLTTLEAFTNLGQALDTGHYPACVVGLSGIHKAHFIASLSQGQPLPGLVITPDEATATRLCEDINVFLGEGAARMLPARQLTLRDVEGASLEYEHQRLSVFAAMAEGRVRVVAASIEAALLHTIPPADLRRHTLELHAAERYQVEEIVSMLVSSGYARVEQIEGVCQFALRGGILDVYAPASPDPVRIEFWGDDIDSIWTFKIDTQRRDSPLESVLIPPAREALLKSPHALSKTLLEISASLRGSRAARQREHITADIERISSGVVPPNIDKYLPLLYEAPATVFDHFLRPRIFLCEPSACAQALKNALWQVQEDMTALLEEGVLFPALCHYYEDFSALSARMEHSPSAVLDTFARSAADIPLRELFSVNAVQLSSWGGELAVLLDDLHAFLERGCRTLVFAGTEKAAKTLVDELTKERLSAVLLTGEGPPAPGTVGVLAGSLSAGFEYPELGLAVLTHQRHRVAAPAKKKGRKKKGEALKSISDLTVGDYVVHVSHGIGVFQGIVKREIHGVTKDYIQIRYAGTDMLFVPVNQLDLVSRYVGGAEDRVLKLNKLNSLEWQKTRQRVKKAVDEMAGELIALYSARMNAKGHAFCEDDDMQRDFESRFAFEETDDQLRSIAEIKADMCRPVPMDRLLCGDVGFGKTEVALRAAFKCVANGKQCAILVPTTILAWQHFQTFRRRMEGFPITVELLSRFRSPKEQVQVVKDLKAGRADIVIGTHRVVQQDVAFKDLGLVVIDEEQRFGVRHKERFKELRKDVDVLALSATPIPRTLNMAMSGIRDMSTIEEAPTDRHPVQTYVLEHDWGVLAEAVRRELRRDGQVFYLHNRIDSIHSTAKRLQDLLPDARITVAHGRMDEDELSSIWGQLVSHEIDVLVCTTIIETGVDVANCNTLIIEDADNMGLSQLYQIRGRVGRSSRRAFAYFTFRPGKEISDVAAKRLTAIREFTSFGSGFRIAMRDLEIRGAGNILGSQQHGHMESVGYEMYLKLLSDAVLEQRGEKNEKRVEECMIDLRLSAHIPEEYIDALPQRIDIYKKIAAVLDDEDASDLIDELIDRFGEPPKAVLGLIDVSLLRNRAANLGITEIQQRDDALLIYQTPLDIKTAGLLASRMKGRVMVSGGQKPYIAVRLSTREDPVEAMRIILDNMRDE